MLTAVAVAGVAVGAVAASGVAVWWGRRPVWRRQRPRWGVGVGRPAVRAVAAATTQLERVELREPWRVGGLHIPEALGLDAQERAEVAVRMQARAEGVDLDALLAEEGLRFGRPTPPHRIRVERVRPEGGGRL